MEAASDSAVMCGHPAPGVTPPQFKQTWRLSNPPNVTPDAWRVCRTCRTGCRLFFFPVFFLADDERPKSPQGTVLRMTRKSRLQETRSTTERRHAS
ncbi:hypothetical protein E2C01_059736 [Portunus trituberculatus]|uniref:Uncharacterized protein n=1 Tax=Portunus trituberculatus TaxID=210409 RepID=A0A5B7H714_PORTR|nr:hypothetical protein [Portunus trituberculatus]